ncbi:hypothetical protein [Candidatus Bealeia paramacronuclearis]|uniref:hypothetical protein n=1 Tax=Candidatus Bealeia paramacronuclearis TaxID=1921001 RepID=UPI0030D147F4
MAIDCTEAILNIQNARTIARVQDESLLWNATQGQPLISFLRRCACVRVGA